MSARSVRSPRTASTPEQSLLDALAEFHSLVDGADVDRVARLASPALLASGWNARFEAAWALLYAFATAPSASGDDYDYQDDDSEIASSAGVGALPSLLPPFRAWMHYLDCFPAGEGLRAYRQERLAFVACWYPHVHPSFESIEKYVRAELDEAARRAIEGHVGGPYHCVSCYRAVEAARGAATGQDRERVIAAFTPDEPALVWRVLASDRGFGVSCVNDEGYLRVFLLPDDPEAIQKARLRATFFLASGTRLESTIAYPEHSLVGVNFGRLSAGGIEDVVGVYLVALPDERL